ncbi:unnamed protein product [Cylicostephanus goldi]|uniref:Uncharacterized protein n=1 Tax=Cylicostephanus goldi TaxID=71465 RepID=A0A3P6RHT1_CYLGO|nr:unnamed protein product [Cylicostephanus goldi]
MLTDKNHHHVERVLYRILARYFSLLSPEEWSREDKTKEYVASYRMEMDRSFTPMADVAKRDAQFRSMEAFLKQSKFKNEFNMGMILSAEQSGS